MPTRDGVMLVPVSVIVFGRRLTKNSVSSWDSGQLARGDCTSACVPLPAPAGEAGVEAADIGPAAGQSNRHDRRAHDTPCEHAAHGQRELQASLSGAPASASKQAFNSGQALACRVGSYGRAGGRAA